MRISQLITKNHNIISFLKDLENICKFNGISLLLREGIVSIGENVEVAGYFSADESTLACNLKPSNWLFTMVHESCHMDQYLEGQPIWDNSESVNQIVDWVNGEEISNISYHINRIILLELDCEYRAIEKIKRYNLPINIEEYCQQANSILASYGYTKIYRSWTTPELKEKIYTKFPKKLMSPGYYKKLSNKVLNLFNGA